MTNSVEETMEPIMYVAPPKKMPIVKSTRDGEANGQLIHSCLKSSSTEFMDNNSEDCVCTDRPTGQNNDQSNVYCFLVIGEHENQVSTGGEADLHIHKNNCRKNPGHPEFIPIESFSLKHLPEGHQDSDLYEYIKAAADLTVKLSVTMTSPGRPEFWPNTKHPYFMSDMRGKKTLRTGTGRVSLVLKYTENDKHMKYKTCPCDKCESSHNPSKIWWEIYVRTAAHVVLDDIEASHTTLTFFYDKEDSEMIIIKNKAQLVDCVIIERDRCQFTCVTCDEKLGNKLEKMVKHCVDVWKKVYDKYIESRDLHKLNFIVSHPHGCSKMVSVGHWKDKVQVGDDKDYHQFTYTTCTCPGSSGASVHSVGYSGVWYYDQIHGGSLKSRLNYGVVGGVYI